MSFQFRENIEQMSGYVPGFQPAGEGVIKINTNENPYPPSPRVMEAIRGISEDQLRKYPPITWDRFRKAAGQVLGVKPDRIICGNGGDELLSMIVRCCCDYNRPLAYPTPTYTLYRVLAQIQGAPVVEVPFGKDHAIPELLYRTGADLTILCNPNAPTGSLVEKKEIAKLAQAVSGVLLVDEAYVDFSPRNCLDLVEKHENVAVLRSLSKGYSLAGMRFGYIVAGDRIAEALMKVKDSYNVNIAAQVAAAAAISDQPYFQNNVRKTIEQRDRLTKELRKMGFKVADSNTNFVLAQIDKLSAKNVYEKLAEQKIYIRYFEEEGLQDKLRISIGTAQQMDTLLAALQQILGQE